MFAVVAGSEIHARAIIRWLDLDEERCVPLAYGQMLKSMYEHAIVVRPTAGTTPADRDWICGQLIPRVAGGIRPHPKGWNPADDDEVPPAEASGAPRLEENPLYA